MIASEVSSHASHPTSAADRSTTLATRISCGEHVSGSPRRIGETLVPGEVASAMPPADSL